MPIQDPLQTTPKHLDAHKRRQPRSVRNPVDASGRIASTFENASEETRGRRGSGNVGEIGNQP
eukprot:4071850-Pyramimonas_sp.AAC.1